MIKFVIIQPINGGTDWYDVRMFSSDTLACQVCTSWNADAEHIADVDAGRTLDFEVITVDTDTYRPVYA
jgi:hypothetical protein